MKLYNKYMEINNPRSTFKTSKIKLNNYNRVETLMDCNKHKIDVFFKKLFF